MARSSFGVLALFIVGAPLALAGETKDEPAIVLRIRSLDAVVDNFQLLANLAGREEAARQIENLIKAKVGEKGLEGIDPRRPLGGYARFGKEQDDVQVVGLVPVADEKGFLDLLTGLGANATKDADGVYSIKSAKTGPAPIAYLRFAKGYAFVAALNKAALDKLPEPGKILAGDDVTTAAFKVRFGALPKQAKQMALAHIEQELQNAQGQAPAGETAAQKAFRLAVMEEATKAIAAILHDGSELAFHVQLDKSRLQVTGSLQGVSNSELTKAIETLGQRRSLFGGIKPSAAAFTGAMHFVLPQAVKDALVKVAEEAIQKTKENIQDPVKRKQAESLLQGLVPTLREGELDAHITVAGVKDGKHAMLVALMIKDGTKLGNTLHDLLAELMKDLAPEHRDRIKLKIAAVGDIKIHRLEAPPEVAGNKAVTAMFGEPYLFVAFRSDALFIGLGEKGLTLVKDALANHNPGPGPALLYEVDLARFAQLLPGSLPEKAKTTLSEAEDARLRLTVEGGRQLTVRFTTHPAVLRFLMQMREAKSN